MFVELKRFCLRSFYIDTKLKIVLIIFTSLVLILTLLDHFSLKPLLLISLNKVYSFFYNHTYNDNNQIDQS